MNDIIDFTLDNQGNPLQVHVEVNYPFYNIHIDGVSVAQLRQDHHSNWFITTGHLDDGLTLEIGRRISFEITGQ